MKKYRVIFLFRSTGNYVEYNVLLLVILRHVGVISSCTVIRIAGLTELKYLFISGFHTQLHHHSHNTHAHIRTLKFSRTRVWNVVSWDFLFFSTSIESQSQSMLASLMLVLWFVHAVVRLCRRIKWFWVFVFEPASQPSS